MDAEEGPTQSPSRDGKEYVISITRCNEKKEYANLCYNLSVKLGIISIDTRKEQSSLDPNEISSSRISQVSHPKKGDIVYIKNVKNNKKETFCKGKIVEPFRKINDLSESLYNRKEIIDIHTKDIDDEALKSQKISWFKTLIHFEYICKVEWIDKNIHLEKNSDMWEKLHPNGRTTIRKC